MKPIVKTVESILPGAITLPSLGPVLQWLLVLLAVVLVVYLLYRLVKYIAGLFSPKRTASPEKIELLPPLEPKQKGSEIEPPAWLKRLTPDRALRMQDEEEDE